MSLIFLLLAAASQGDFDKEKLDNWHQWRGPNADGISPQGDPAVEWSESKNVRWKVKIDGDGCSTPIVWKDRIFVLTSVKTDRKPDKPVRRVPSRAPARLSTPPPDTLCRFEVLCLDRATGKELWRKVAREEVPHEGRHPTHGYASASPTTDGKFLYVSFGSRGFYCYDLDGKKVWERDLGKMRTRASFGEGSSPVLHKNRLIVLWDHEEDSSLLCLDARTGKDKWRVPRDEGSSWSTPLIVEHEGVTQIVVNGANRVRGYDFANGKVLWACGGQTGNTISSPAVFDGIIYCMSGFRGAALYAIPLKARGDITGSSKIAWKRGEATPYVPSPLVLDGLLYFNKVCMGVLSCVDARTGKPHYDQQRLEGLGTVYASPTAAAGRIYIADRDGNTLVLKHGKEYKTLATNKLDDGMNASPVIVGKELFLRTHRNLYCIVAK